jgi:peptide/nickel transport system permease protein
MLLKYMIRRTIAAIPVLFGVTIITYSLLAATTGDWVPGLEANPNLKPEDVARIRHNIGLDQPWYLQYLNWLGIPNLLSRLHILPGDYQTGLLEGDFGRSILDGSPVVTHVLDRLPNTLELTVTAILFGILLAIPLGVTGALRRGSLIDHFLTTLSVAGVAVPTFWLGLLLILLFSVQFHAWGLPWLPASGAYSPLFGGDFVDRLAHLIMPAMVLAFGYIAIWSRYSRSSMLEVLSLDYVRTARAKGMAERRVVYIHALRNAIVPLVTLVGLELPALVGGGAVVEIVFSWPGIGRLALERALDHDYTTVMGLVTFAGILVVFGNLLADVLYAVLDPRIRYT